jgi:hypothetical protein
MPLRVVFNRHRGLRRTLSPEEMAQARKIAVPALAALGLAFLAVGGYHAWLGMASESWPTAEGKILSSRVQSRRDRDSNGRATTQYTAKVDYEYQVGDRRYRSQRIQYGLFTSNVRGQARSVVDRYPQGQAVQVRYDPDSPETAVLDPGPHPLALLFAGVGGLCVVLSLWMAIRPAPPGALPPGADPFGPASSPGQIQ